MIKRVVTLILVFIIGASPIFAASNTDKADILYNLGLFKGTDEGYELTATFTRVQAAVMIVRFLGLEDEVLSSNFATVFDDVANDNWGIQYVMYCYDNGITKGTGDREYSPENPISGEEFVTLLLRSIGYLAEPDTAYNIAIAKSMLTSSFVGALKGQTAFLRDDMVYIAYRALKTLTSDGITLADTLMQKGVFTQEQAYQAGLLIGQEDNMNDLLDMIFD
ncbi:MAG: S-layer homology domain-containing protein [Firmicutes bacterium]|nr:S-layer homology domain-containing protein [Bacillota bacterium]